jgi:hypothetical protein
MYRTLANLPHATRGDPEDANTGGEDHLPDAFRYLLINLGGGPQFPVFDDAVVGMLEAEGIEVLEEHGRFAQRPSPADELFGSEERNPSTRMVQLSPYV